MNPCLNQEEILINPKFGQRPEGKNDSFIRINFKIRAREVRVISDDGGQVGIMDVKTAIQLAQSKGLDLVEISPNANPPVCKILDFGKFKYEQKKKQKQAKKNQVIVHLKEVQFRPQTDKHDIDFKVKHIQRFLSDGDKVKVSIRFRGRESAHTEIGYSLIKQIIDMVGASGIVEQAAKMEGKVLSLIFAPAGKVKKPAASVPAGETGSKNTTTQLSSGNN